MLNLLQGHPESDKYQVVAGDVGILSWDPYNSLSFLNQWHSANVKNTVGNLCTLMDGINKGCQEKP